MMNLHNIINFLVGDAIVSPIDKGRYVTTSGSLVRNSTVRIILGSSPQHYNSLLNFSHKIPIGWGRKKSGRQAEKIASRTQMPHLLLEDGFLRSVDRNDPSLSLVVDHIGIYYDAETPSSLELKILENLDVNDIIRSHNIIDTWQKHRLSKYNSYPEYEGFLPHPYVLVIDQVSGDLSIECGLANRDSFSFMLDTALRENPEATIIVKVHPDIRTKSKSGNFNIDELESNPRIMVVPNACHPVRLIEHADAVYVVTSQVGFEALIWGKRVRCFGMPFFAGWGLTEDELPPPQRRSPVSLEQLVFAALVKYPRYVNHELGSLCEVEETMHHIALQREMRNRFVGRIFALGFSPWKQPILARFLQGAEISFVEHPNEVPKGATVAIWGATVPSDLPTPTRILRVEDGFLRSAGLGANQITPMSWVIDTMGMYYDTTKPSGLEYIIQTTTFSVGMLKRAERLKNIIIDEGITKYNSSSLAWKRPNTTKRLILVVGQVENDLSLLLGGSNITTNIDLLKLVRSENKDAYIVYKSHPDIVANLRNPDLNIHDANLYCDEFISDIDAHSILKYVDEVHTITSLMGFEGLIRGIKVVCYGQPFYSGWGLTQDIVPQTRRHRRLALDELIAATLILYPTYVSRITNAYITPEGTIKELIEWRRKGPSKLPYRQRVWRLLRQTWKRASTKYGKL